MSPLALISRYLRCESYPPSCGGVAVRSPEACMRAKRVISQPQGCGNSSMKPETTNCQARDILRNPLLSFALFCLPIIAMVAAGSHHISRGWRTVIWTAALSVMGTACLANAARCGRVHCYLTGPFLLGMAVVTLLYGVGVVPLGANGWNLISLTTLVGAIALCCVPELFFGRYRGNSR